VTPLRLHVVCDCGREVPVRATGRVGAHRTRDGRTCGRGGEVPPADALEAFLDAVAGRAVARAAAAAVQAALATQASEGAARERVRVLAWVGRQRAAVRGAA